MYSKYLNSCILLILFILGFGTSNNALSQKDSLYFVTILEYGLPEYQEYYEVRDSINKKWNIKYVRVAGCIVNEELVDSVNNFNKTSYLRLEKQFGKDWKELYDTDMDEALRIEEICQESIFSILMNVENDSVVENIKSNGKNIWTFSYEGKENTKGFKTNIQHGFVEIKNLNDSNTEIVYRGIKNLFEFNVNNLNDTFLFKCNCLISKTPLGDSTLLPPYQFYIYPNANKECKLTISNNEEDSITFSFKTLIFPIPTIHLDEVLVGDTLKRSLISSTIDVSLAMPEWFTYNLEKSYIKSWEVKSGDSLLGYGRGNSIDVETTKKIMQLDEGSILEIYCKIKGADNRIRGRKGRFIIY